MRMNSEQLRRNFRISNLTLPYLNLSLKITGKDIPDLFTRFYLIIISVSMKNLKILNTTSADLLR